MFKQIYCLVLLFLIIYMTNTYAQESEESIKSMEMSKRAKLYWDNRSFDEALEYAELAIVLDSNNIQAYWIMVNVYGFKGPIDKKIEVLNKIIDINPNDFKAYYHLYIAYNREHDYEKAKIYWEKTILLNSNYIEAYRSMAIYYASKEKNYTKAISMLDKAIEIEPSNAEIYILKSNYFIKAGNYADALKCAEEGININNSYSPGYVQVAKIYYDLDIFLDIAIRYLDKAIKLDEKLNEYDRIRTSESFFLKHLLKGKILFKLNKKDAAKKEFEYVAKNAMYPYQAEEAKKQLKLL